MRTPRNTPRPRNTRPRNLLKPLADLAQKLRDMPDPARDLLDHVAPARPSYAHNDPRFPHEYRRRCTALTVGVLLVHTCWLLTGCGEVDARTSAKIRIASAAEVLPGPAIASNHEVTLQGVRRAYDVVLRNLANAQTPGYQAIRPIFESSTRDTPGSQGVMRPVMHRDPSPGRPVPTGRWLDVAIEGNGYFIVDDPEAGGIDGLAYTRAGRLFVNRDGRLVVGSFEGPALEPVVTFPDDYRDIRIEPTGIVSVMPGEGGEWMPVGLINLARFANDAGLATTPAGLSVATAQSGPPLVDVPGGLGLGTLRYKHLEGSNVDVVAELRELNQLREWGAALSGLLGVDPHFATEPAAAAQWLGAGDPSPATSERPLAEAGAARAAW